MLRTALHLLRPSATFREGPIGQGRPSSEGARPPSVPKRLGLFVFYTMMLSASFLYDVFRVSVEFRPEYLHYEPYSSEGFRAEYIGSDSEWVLNRLQLATEPLPFWSPMGIYRSQFGLQGSC
ncbi:hypothetical protein BH23PLA1_BH23PLA1_02330 [soil metagenome]